MRPIFLLVQVGGKQLRAVVELIIIIHSFLARSHLMVGMVDQGWPHYYIERIAVLAPNRPLVFLPPGLDPLPDAVP